MMVIKIIVTALTAAILSGIIRQYKPEYAILVQIGGGLLILFMILNEAKAALSGIQSMLDQLGDNKSYAELLIKALGISILTQFGADVCIDAGEKSLASKIELGGKLTILVLALPLFNAVAQLAVGIIRGV